MRRLVLAFTAAAVLAGGSFNSAFAAAVPAATPSPSPSPGDALQQAQQKQQLLQQVQQKLGQNIADGLTAQDRLDQSLKENTKSQNEVTGKIDAAKRKLAMLQAKIDALDASIAATKSRIDRERMELRALARSIYVQPSSALLMVAECDNLGELVTRIADLASAGQRAYAFKDALRIDLDNISAERDQQQQAKDQEVATSNLLKAALAELQDLQQKQQAARDELSAKIDQTKAELKDVNQQSVQLAQEIQQLLQQQEEEIIASGYSSIWAQVKVWQEANPMTGFPTSSGHSKTFRFIWPEPQGVITQPFGPSPYWFEPPYGGFPHFHTGIDLSEPEGSPVFVADDGIVVLVGHSNVGYGNYVVVAHADGLATLYGHLLTTLVKVGDKVSQGQPIGLEGSTGNSTGPHCHFELRINGVPEDPSPYLPPAPPSAFKA